MYHSVIFGDKNTYKDWHLVPSSRPVIKPPQQKRTVVDIPGSDGVLDMSTMLTGYPIYQNRKGSLEFIVLNGYDTWENIYSDVLDYLHGRTRTLILEDDPNYFYTGTFEVSEWASQKDNSRITINYDLEPYKLRTETSIEDPLQKLIFKDIIVDSDTERGYRFLDSVGRKPVIPLFKVEGTEGKGLDIRLENPELGINVQGHFEDGEWISTDFVLTGFEEHSEMSLFMKGHGKVSVIFRSGRL